MRWSVGELEPANGLILMKVDAMIYRGTFENRQIFGAQSSTITCHDSIQTGHDKNVARQQNSTESDDAGSSRDIGLMDLVQHLWRPMIRMPELLKKSVRNKQVRGESVRFALLVDPKRENITRVRFGTRVATNCVNMPTQEHVAQLMSYSKALSPPWLLHRNKYFRIAGRQYGDAVAILERPIAYLELSELRHQRLDVDRRSKI
jgi:hypothetical protein